MLIADFFSLSTAARFVIPEREVNVCSMAVNNARNVEINNKRQGKIKST